MAGYTRQAAANISNGNVADADDIDLELDAIAAAFSGVSGHLHDGSTGNGPKINLTTSVVGVLPVANGGTGLTDLTLLTLTSTDSGALGAPELNLFRDSATPAASDVIGFVEFAGNDSGLTKTAYARILGLITDPTDTSEDGSLIFARNVAGTMTTAMTIGTEIALTANLTTANSVTLTSTDAGATPGPGLFLYRNSASPAGSDFLGAIRFQGEDDAGNTESYAGIVSQIEDASNGAEIGTLIFQANVNGTLTSIAKVEASNSSISPIGNTLQHLGSLNLRWGTTWTQNLNASAAVTVGTNINLSSGSTLNWNSSDVVVTHAANTLIFNGATTGYRFGDGPVTPATNDGSALGTSSLSWSDLFLASGSVINWNSGDITLTHTNPNLLTFAGATQFDFGSATLDVADAQGFRVGGSGGATYTTYTSGFTTITALVPGSAFGGYIEGYSAGHIVLGIRDNDSNDSVSIISYNGTGAYSKLVAQFKADGLVSIPSTTSDPVFTVGTVSTTGVTYGKDISSTAFRSSRTETISVQHVQFYNPNGLVGSVSTNASATAYNTSSDGRLKENFRLFDSGYLIDNLEAGLFDWKTGGTGYGVIAQDAQKVFPDAITENEDGYLAADYSKFVPILLREVKELRKRVAQLEGICQQ